MVYDAGLCSRMIHQGQATSTVTAAEMAYHWGRSVVAAQVDDIIDARLRAERPLIPKIISPCHRKCREVERDCSHIGPDLRQYDAAHHNAFASS